MHFSEWIKQEKITYAEAAQRCDLPNAMAASRYARNVVRPRPARQRDIYVRTGGKVALADWYPEMRGAIESNGQLNGDDRS
jgi:hypothetical protein